MNRYKRFWGRIWDMIRAFFRRWWMTHKLHVFINKKEVPHLGGFNYPTSKATRIRNGANEEAFLEWYWLCWEGWENDLDRLAGKGETWLEKRRYQLPWKKTKKEYFRQQAERTLEECISRKWIERTGGNVHLGKDIDAWVWYFPILSLFKFIEGNKLATGTAWTILIYLLALIFSPLICPHLMVPLICHA